MGKAALDRSGLPYPVRFAMTRKGFKPSNYVLYDLAHNDVADYVPDSLYAALCQTNGRVGVHVLGSKLLFHKTFQDELALAELHGHISRGRFTSLRDGAGPGRTELEPLLVELGALVVKPVVGQKGKRVHLLTTSPRGFAVDGLPLSPSEFRTWLARQDGALVHSRVQQASYADAIFPGSANTVRIVTVTDADGPFVLSAGHRFGRTTSAPVDNFAAGGLLCGIDLATGAIGPGASLPAPGARGVRWHTVHPDTGTPVAGQLVPGFPQLLDLLLATCRRHPYLAYVGWDVVVTDDGPVVLEANYGSGLQLQLYGGFLRNERFARFVDDSRAAQQAAATARSPSG